jgi:hexokinase
MCYQKYPNFANRVHTALVDIFGEKGKRIVTHHAEDGSGVGSAIIAGESAGSDTRHYNFPGWRSCSGPC